MESKKFYNLSNNYKEFLNVVNNKNIIIDKYTKLKILNKIHFEIENILNNYTLEIHDINNLLLNYNKENENVNILKKLVYFRNCHILQKVIRTNEWKEFISNLTETCKTKYDNLKQSSFHINILVIQNIFIELLKKYMDYWNGFWKYFKFNKNLTIYKISIIDPNDFTFIYKSIENNSHTYNSNCNSNIDI